ncbi:hypothetical protein M378DRAFT_826583 [Amanita muscaria Koide BX008]|uniref:Uncharacterized protein n=1 Tax=Amanita muscaria (strain Koide BX008) TaxID=946122 RepID=A0A0C2SYY5_AMAMK|nr:hypothetical protein M378DRAFT_826583 [Amanita muscaria Koide BX008]
MIASSHWTMSFTPRRVEISMDLGGVYVSLSSSQILFLYVSTFSLEWLILLHAPSAYPQAPPSSAMMPSHSHFKHHVAAVLSAQDLPSHLQSR